MTTLTGASRKGLAVVRSLEQHGVRFRVADFKTDRPNFSSEHCRLRQSPVVGVGKYVSLLERVAQAATG